MALPSLEKRRSTSECTEKSNLHGAVTKWRAARPGSREAEALARRRKQDQFLAAFSTRATISAAAKAIAVGRRTHYLWLETDKAYAARFKDAEEDVTESLEAEARRRAVDGLEEPVHYQGERVDTIRRYSDTLLIFLLKARRPEVYRERFDHQVVVEGVDELIQLGRPAAAQVTPRNQLRRFRLNARSL